MEEEENRKREKQQYFILERVIEVYQRQ